MRIAVISDIHSNFEAFKAVLSDMSDMGYDMSICLGDIVGYGPEPVKCIELVQKNEIMSLLGNHDAAVCGLLDVDYFNIYAREAVKWTIDKMDKKDFDFLSNLKNEFVHENIVFVHGALTAPFDYILDANSLNVNADILKNDRKGINICFFGHTHVPFLSRNGTFELIKEGRYRLENIEKGYFFINPGSVGQPRGGFSNKASYCIYDLNKNELILRNVQYDVDATVEKIVEYGLPEYLGQRLYKGF